MFFQGMLERLVKLVNSQNVDSSTWISSWAVLSNMAATHHGIVALLKQASLLPEVMRITQELSRKKQWCKLPAVLAVLANVAASREGQRALLKSAEPSGAHRLANRSHLLCYSQASESLYSIKIGFCAEQVCWICW